MHAAINSLRGRRPGNMSVLGGARRENGAAGHPAVSGEGRRNYDGIER